MPMQKTNYALLGNEGKITVPSLQEMTSRMHYLSMGRQNSTNAQHYFENCKYRFKKQFCGKSEKEYGQCYISIKMQSKCFLERKMLIKC